MSFLQKLGICAGLLIVLFFSAEIFAMPGWVRIASYYGMLAVAIYGVVLVVKSSAPPEKADKKK